MDIFKYICHRRSDRSFHFHGHQFPVCARCTGFYISIFVYVIYAYWIKIIYTMNLLIFGLILLIPCFIDGFTQLFKLRESNNYFRLITGLMGGIGLMIIFKFLKFLIITNLFL